MTSPSAPDPIHICGEALIDFVPVRTARGQNGYVPKPGGSPYNVAVAAARAGGAPRFVGEISTDFFGEMLHDHLVANRVDCRHVERSDRLSTLAFVDLSSGCPRYAFHNEGTTNQAMTPRIPHDGQRSILHVGSISLIPEGAGDRILELTRRHLPHGIVSLDPNVRSSLIGDRRNWLDRIRALCSHTSILKLSVEDIDYLSPESDAEAFAASAIADGIDMVIVTRDSEGAQAMTAEGAISVNVRPRHIHDTVGAGDTLTGAVLTWLAGRRINTRDAVRTLPPQSLETMLRFAVTAAALNCEAEGCDPPTRSMIEDRLTDVSRVTGTIRGRDADMHHHILSDSLQ
ncbi:MAG: PfkB family carbohydrate kinase, partial [Rhodobacteraceae bacterium]|nr:PfkB family carbohydrate kinase [Paracoccaceae bacterium]